MVQVRIIQNKFKFILMQIQNDALADGRVTSDERKILVAFKDMIKDLPDIVETLAATTDIKPDSNNKEDIVKLMDEVLQFILAHLMDVAKESGDVSTQEFALLEIISQRLEEYLDSFIKTNQL